MQRSVSANISNENKQHQLVTSVDNIIASHLHHLDSLRKRHAYRLNSQVGCSWLQRRTFFAAALGLVTNLGVRLLLQTLPSARGGSMLVNM